MRLISKKIIKKYINKNAPSKKPLLLWSGTVEECKWNDFHDVKQTYNTASNLTKRVVFNVGGNKYRVVTAIHYNRGIVHVIWIGTHAEYNNIDADTVKLQI